MVVFPFLHSCVPAIGLQITLYIFHSIIYSVCFCTRGCSRSHVSPGSLPSPADLSFLSMLSLGHRGNESGDLASSSLSRTAAEMDCSDCDRRGFRENPLTTMVLYHFKNGTYCQTFLLNTLICFRFRNKPFDVESGSGAWGPSFGCPPFQGKVENKGCFLNGRVWTLQSLLSVGCHVLYPWASRMYGILLAGVQALAFLFSCKSFSPCCAAALVNHRAQFKTRSQQNTISSYL